MYAARIICWVLDVHLLGLDDFGINPSNEDDVGRVCSDATPTCISLRTYTEPTQGDDGHIRSALGITDD